MEKAQKHIINRIWNHTFGVSSPANPLRIVLDPMSKTMAPTSSGMIHKIVDVNSDHID